ncbi:hypothetical protein MKX19_02035 [Acinetobacter pittii]|uniref:hypothetical protein n=1 Tax=Acinetobacter TaxID=469 RepID=UPI001E3B5155|nr:MULTISPECIES: hypothetical protein [Acinetobacter]MDR0066368.1 hypothetical protein [Acinetobacter sp. 11520]MCH2010894.1 hypothetical protein [Acinetobacter pittii]MCK0877105.1 hypothetical protein [Acinetobacter pittii]MDA3447599.1 hypothetical protein [Acinetobacter sp. AOR40_HL]MDA3455050.1 hypothetical protein [Acinetobacter sp. AOR39_HL]
MTNSLETNKTTSLLGTDTLIDLVAIAGYYTLISMTINVFEVPPPAGVAPELPTPKAGI